MKYLPNDHYDARYHRFKPGQRVRIKPGIDTHLRTREGVVNKLMADDALIVRVIRAGEYEHWHVDHLESAKQ